MAWVQAHAALAVDQFGHAWQRPKVVEEAVGLRALQERFLQLLLVGRGQLGPAPQWPTLPGRPTNRLALLFPAQCGGAADPAAPRDFSLGKPLVEESHSFPPSLFHSFEIPLGSRCHARRVCYSFMRE